MNYKKEVWQNFALVTQLGLSVMVPVFLCIGIGLFLEKRFDINLTIFLLVLGILAGGRNAYMLAKKRINNDRSDIDGFKDEGNSD